MVTAAPRIRRGNVQSWRKTVVAKATALAIQRERQLREEIAQETVDAEAIRERHERDAQRAECAASFRAFLRHWRFVDRETGTVRTFANLWPAQEDFAELMGREPWIFALKAGKLGFTELECAYDAWVALYRQPNAHVGVFSKDLSSAKVLLRYVRTGIQRLPEWLRLPVADGPGSDTAVSLMLRAGPDDVRTITSYAAKPTTAIDVTLAHEHVDELSNMIDPEGVWGSISTVVSPTGSCHVVTRGRGLRVYTAKLWATCRNNGGDGKLWGFFSPWSGRPRPEGWREAEVGTMTRQAARWYAPETVEDALAGDQDSQFVELAQWDTLFDEQLRPLAQEANFWTNLAPGDRTPLVIGLDAGVKRDLFALVAVSRHPRVRGDVAVRACAVWRPQDDPSGHVDLDHVEKRIVGIIKGTCARGHPHWRIWKDPECDECKKPEPAAPGLNVRLITYDPYQLAEMGDRLRIHRVAWSQEFGQQGDRLEADSDLRGLIVQGRIRHGEERGGPLRSAVEGAAAEYQRGELEERKLRIIKAAPNAKIDALVALSMASKRALALNLGSG